MAAPAITPADLVERLREVMHARTDEQLAAMLDVPLRSLSAYKKGQRMGFNRTVELLDLAGWLAVSMGNGEPPEAAKIREARRVAAELAARAERLADLLG